MLGLGWDACDHTSSSLTGMSFRLEQKHHFFKAGCSAAFTQKKPHCGPLPLPPLCQGCLSSALCDALLPLPPPDTPVRQGTGHEYGCPLYGSQFYHNYLRNPQGNTWEFPLVLQPTR